MKILIIFISAIFMNFNLFSQVIVGYDDIENDTIILWSKERKIKWLDFQGKEVENKNAKAESGVGLNMESFYTKNENYEYLVFAYFDKRKSSHTIENNYLLRHEQIHFNIGEIFARKIRKQILLLKKEKIKNIDYNKIFYTFLNELNAFQNKYDIQTKHSTVYNKQKEWDKKVLDELGSLEQFSLENYLDMINNKSE